jgi:hypothetical protein
LIFGLVVLIQYGLVCPEIKITGAIKMKKLTAAAFALAMIMSLVFIGEAASPNTPFSPNAASAQVKVRHRRHGVARRYYGHSKRGAQKGFHKSKRGTKWTAHKTKRGTKVTFHKSKRGTKRTFHKIKNAVQ